MATALPLVNAHACRPNCGACCIAISISPSYPALPQGKPAGVPCQHLTPELLCSLFNQPTRPETCKRFNLDPETCGTNAKQALINLEQLEQLTQPENNHSF